VTLRILVTGSRDWTDRDTIRAALADALGTHSTIGLPVLVTPARTVIGGHAVCLDHATAFVEEGLSATVNHAAALAKREMSQR
jgi:hypothetical protein